MLCHFLLGAAEERHEFMCRRLQTLCTTEYGKRSAGLHPGSANESQARRLIGLVSARAAAHGAGVRHSSLLQRVRGFKVQSPICKLELESTNKQQFVFIPTLSYGLPQRNPSRLDSGHFSHQRSPNQERPSPRDAVQLLPFTYRLHQTKEQMVDVGGE